jgi:hypothetical protein
VDQNTAKKKRKRESFEYYKPASIPGRLPWWRHEKKWKDGWTIIDCVRSVQNKRGVVSCVSPNPTQIRTGTANSTRKNPRSVAHFLGMRFDAMSGVLLDRLFTEIAGARLSTAYFAALVAHGSVKRSVSKHGR